MAKTTSTRRGVASNAPAKKRLAVAKKPAPTKQTSSSLSAAALALEKLGAQVRRPDKGSDITIHLAGSIANELDLIRDILENYANHLRSLDRKRLNGVGIKNQGFIERALALAEDGEDFLPHWLPMTKFEQDVQLFSEVRRAFDVSKIVSEFLWNIVMDASDMAYTDALEFYSSIREAAKRRVDGAETINSELREFFKSRGRGGKGGEDEPTEAEIKRDVSALLRGRKDGKVVVENISPKTGGGERKLIDETL